MRRSSGFPLIVASSLFAPLHSANSQSPVARLTYIAPDSVGVHLLDSGYVMLIQFQPGSKPRVLYPGPEAEWTLRSRGKSTVRIPHQILRSPNVIVNPSPQCIIRYKSVTSWSERTGPSPLADRKACGPTLRLPYGGYGPWSDWQTPHYEFAGTDPYLLLIVFDGATEPVGLPDFLNPRTPQAPVELAQSVGYSLAPNPTAARRWQAALWTFR